MNQRLGDPGRRNNGDFYLRAMLPTILLVLKLLRVYLLITGSGRGALLLLVLSISVVVMRLNQKRHNVVMTDLI